MREEILSNCERNFILNAALELKRLDGRKLDEFRNLSIHFGSDWGLCYTSLGETRVVAQVRCEVQQPKTTRPNEGLIFINAEVSSMAAPYIEPGRSSDVSVHLNRLLEKCIKDSKAVDLESLCLVAEEKVWVIRVDVTILNHDGNLVQAASISSLAALAHFKRPDVTTSGQDIVIHDITERDPIPLTLYHYPVCINFALLNSGERVLADPTSIEEKISDASLVFAINSYGELCGLDLGGTAQVEPNLVLRYSHKASVKAKETVEAIKVALKKDAEARQSNMNVGLVESLHWDKAKSLSDSRLMVQLSKFKPNVTDKYGDGDVDMNLVKDEIRPKIIDLGDNCAELIPSQEKKLSSFRTFIKEEETIVDDKNGKVVQLTDAWGFDKIGEGGPSKWEAGTSNEHESVEGSDAFESKPAAVPETVKSEAARDADMSGDSEEEVVTLQPQGIGTFVETSKTPYPKPRGQQPRGQHRGHPRGHPTGHPRGHVRGHPRGHSRGHPRGQGYPSNSRSYESRDFRKRNKKKSGKNVKNDTSN